MSASIVRRKVGDVLFLDIAGRITLGEGSCSLQDAIREAVKKGDKQVVLNMAETVYVDSTGIAEMVSGFATLANQGASLKLLALNRVVKNLLQITKLYLVFETFDTETEAIRSFNSFN